MSAPSPGGAPSGAQKVAAFLLSLEREVASSVMKTLDPLIVPQVADAMSAMGGEFSAEKVEDLYRELARSINQKSGPTAPPPTELGAMLTKAYGREKADEILERLRRRERLEHPFGFLEKRPGSVVYRLLARESASVCALVLAFMPPALASDVLGRLEPELMLETVKRLASLGSPNETVLQSVAQELRARLATAESVPTSTDPSLRKKQIAEVLKFSRPEIESSVLEGLHNEDEMVAAEIREFLFSWGDLAGVDKRAMAKILSTVDTRTLSIALKGSAPDVEENIMNNLSARVRAMVAEERDLSGPMPMSEVVLARTEMLNSVRALIESGEMQPQKAGEELVN
jgi:flagellar motor switch protein FliG